MLSYIHCELRLGEKQQYIIDILWDRRSVQYRPRGIRCPSSECSVYQTCVSPPENRIFTGQLFSQHLLTYVISLNKQIKGLISHGWKMRFSIFSCMFLNSNIFFSNLNYDYSNSLNMRNLQELVKKAFCCQKLFWPFTVWINCSRDLKNFANYWPSALNFKSFSWLLEKAFFA